MTSRYLSPGQLRGLLRVGDLLVPGDEKLPSFSASGCVREVDRALVCVNEADRKGLGLLLGAFRFTPLWTLRGLFALAEKPRGVPGALAANLRLVWIGVKGVVMTLYYSDVGEGAAVFEAIGWDARVGEPAESKAEEP